MGRPKVKIYYLLMPLAMLYGMVVFIRNKLFDWRVLKSQSFPLPVICIGNLAVGGTGKTPHTEYVARLLKDRVRTAVLSRGYGRRTRGFALVGKYSDPDGTGDEPQQIKYKFGDDIIVAVDESRRDGIARLLAAEDKPGAIILDDAMQHRYVKPGLTIMLTSYDRPFTDDTLLPAGRLRENPGEKHRADIIIVTKCPDGLTPIDYRIMRNKIKPYPYQRLFFTTFAYGDLRRVDDDARLPLAAIGRGRPILLIAGIANPAPLIQRVKAISDNVTMKTYGDHHRFTNADLRDIAATFDRMHGDDKLVITTEKDAARLRPAMQVIGHIAGRIYALPVEVRFLLGQEQEFNDIIIRHVRKNK